MTIAGEPLGAPRRLEIPLQGIRFSALRWDPPRGTGNGRGAVLLHGVQSSAGTTAGLGSALAERGWTVTALDLPGHGHTCWLDPNDEPLADPESVEAARYRLDVVAALTGRAIASLGLDRPPALIGHSWGAAIAAFLAAIGPPLEVAILIDPPIVDGPRAIDIRDHLLSELRPDLPAALDYLRSEPDAHDGLELRTRAEALAEASPHAVDSVVTGGGWTPGEILARYLTTGAGVPVHVVAGEAAFGGLVPTEALAQLRAVLGDGRVQLIRGAGHSPQGSHFPELLALLLRILG